VSAVSGVGSGTGSGATSGIATTMYLTGSTVAKGRNILDQRNGIYIIHRKRILQLRGYLSILQMDSPKTRREKKKDPREKGAGKDGKYSTKHVRMTEALKSKK